MRVLCLRLSLMLPHFLKTAPVGITCCLACLPSPNACCLSCRAASYLQQLTTVIADPSRRSKDFRGSLNTRRDEPYHDTSLSDIVQKVEARNKLNATLAAGLSTIKVSHIDQTQETATTFITQLASLDTASHKEQSGISLDLTRSLRKQVFCSCQMAVATLSPSAKQGRAGGPVL